MKSHSDIEPIGKTSSFKKLMAQVNERKAWEAANPEIAAAWGEAWQEDAARSRVEEAKRRQEEGEQDAVHVLRKAGVPERVARAVKALDIEAPGVRAARRWMLEPKGVRKTFLVLTGDPGTGKTVAAASAMLNELTAADMRGMATGVQREVASWCQASELATLSSFTEAHRDWLERLERCWLLVLDDLGAEALGDHAQARLERLIDVRHGNYRSTVITSNLGDVGEVTFEKRVGKRIYDRLKESGRRVNCGNKSLRGVAG